MNFMDPAQEKDARQGNLDAPPTSRMFFGTSEFEFLKPLEDNWETIKRELMQLQDADYTPWVDKHLYTLKEGWKVFTLYAFGVKQERNCEAFPETTRLVERIPGMRTAAFSRLLPGTRLVPHRGWKLSVYRAHLGLIVPRSCAIKVNGETKAWEAGKCFVFDDTYLHEAWNNGEGDRIVLLVDFLKEPEKFNLLASVIGYLIIVQYQFTRLLHCLKRF
jgi:aspartyl/asparaginyl beta-hydroxylase (cupin superfamily)